MADNPISDPVCNPSHPQNDPVADTIGMALSCMSLGLIPDKVGYDVMYPNEENTVQRAYDKGFEDGVDHNSNNSKPEEKSSWW